MKINPINQIGYQSNFYTKNNTNKKIPTFQIFLKWFCPMTNTGFYAIMVSRKAMRAQKGEDSPRERSESLRQRPLL